MRSLKRLRGDIHHLDPPLLIHLAREAVIARPFMCRPWSSFLRRWILIVLALKPEGLVAPGKFQETEDLLKGFAIDPIAFALVARGGADVNLLCHLIQPSRLISAREADKGPALC